MLMTFLVILLGIIPTSWLKYRVKSTMSLAQWFADFVKRLRHFEDGVSSGFRSVWLGGLSFPQGWVTASRQEAARRQGTPLEQLRLSLAVGASSGPDDDAFNVEGAYDVSVL